jgi:cytochrome c6
VTVSGWAGVALIQPKVGNETFAFGIELEPEVHSVGIVFAASKAVILLQWNRLGPMSLGFSPGPHKLHILLDALHPRRFKYDLTCFAGQLLRQHAEDKLVSRVPAIQFPLPIFLLSGVLLLACPPATAQGSTGAATFKSKCALCHGADGAGNTTLGKQLQAANLRSKDVQKKTDAELHKAVHDGNGNMPPFAEQLSDTEINQVIKFIRTLGKTTTKKN